MNIKKSKAHRLIRNQRGQGLTEYIILLLLISIVSIAAVQKLGGTIKRRINKANQEITQRTDGNEDNE